MHTKKKAALSFIFITLLIDVTGLGIVIPVLPKLIGELTGKGVSESAVYGGWLLFAYAIMQFIFSPIMGSLSDKYGRRKILLLSLLGFGLDYLFQAVAPTIGWLFVGRILAGITGASMTTATAYIADISEPEKRAQNFGLIGAAFGVGFILGPVIGGLLGQFGSRIPFYAAAVLALLNAAYGYFVLPESLALENRREFDWKRANPIGSLKQLNKYPFILGLAGVLFVISIASHSLQTTWSYFAIEKFQWNEAQVGYSLGFVGIMVAIVQGGLIRFINPKLGEKRSIFVGLALYVIGYFLFGMASQGWMMYAILVPFCLGGIAPPAIQGLMSNKVPNNEQGELQGMMTGLVSLTAIIGPPVMSNLFAFFSVSSSSYYFPGAPFLLSSMLALVSLLLANRILKKMN